MSQFLKKFTLALVFCFIGIFCFMLLAFIRPTFTTLDETLASNADTTTGIYQDSRNNLMAMYDAASWIFLIAPFFYLLMQVLKREPETTQYGGYGGYA